MDVTRYIVLSLACLCFSMNPLWSNETVLSGTYQGMDIFVQNPYNRENQKFCTNQVFVNDKLLLNEPRISAYKIDLSYLKNGDLVIIRITYSQGCKPSIVNPDALKATSSFKFLSVQADLNSISWSSEGDETGGYYYLEQKFKGKDWFLYDSLTAKTEFKLTKYSLVPVHKKGINNYRIYYQNTDGSKFYSMEFQYESSEKYITFSPTIATTSLVLSDTTEYVIEDYFGKLVKKGKGIQVQVNSLKAGKYYIIIQNRKEQFIKR